MIKRHILDSKQNTFLTLVSIVYPDYYPRFIHRLLGEVTYLEKDKEQLQFISTNIKFMLNLSPIELERWKNEKLKMNKL